MAQEGREGIQKAGFSGDFLRNAQTVYWTSLFSGSQQKAAGARKKWPSGDHSQRLKKA